MGVFETLLGAAFCLVVTVAYWRVLASRPEISLTEPPAVEALKAAKRRFISEMNRRIAAEPQVAPQLQTLRDMVVGWYELEGPVSGVRFVARACCETCYQLDGRQLSLLDVHQLAKLVPPVHRETPRKGDCSCTLMPVTVGRGDRPSATSRHRSIAVSRS